MHKLLLGLMLLASPVVAEDNYERLVSEVTPKVVHITVSGVGSFETIFSSVPIVASMTITGAGAFISKDGLVLTCDHLFESEPVLTNQQIRVRTSDGYYYRAWVLAQDKEKDLALLKVFPLNPVPYLQRDGVVKAGQRILAFGSPLGIQKSVSIGYVSVPSTKVGKNRRMVHSAATNPGNSGGPLVDTNGRLVGVNVATFVAGFFQLAEGMHVGVSISDIKTFLGENHDKTPQVR